MPQPLRARLKLEPLEARLALSLTTLASFNGTTEGIYPISGVVVDSSGNLYGTTSNMYLTDPIGTTVFEVAHESGAVTTLATGSDGYHSVVVDSNGNLYGTAGSTVFEVAKGSGKIETLATITNGDVGTDSGDPSDLLIDGNGNLYGTTFAPQTVFELTEGSGTAKTLASYNGSAGDYLGGNLVRDTAGTLYGTTDYGTGSVFEVLPGSGMIKTLASFSDGTANVIDLYVFVVDSSGNLYGTLRTYEGRYDAGAVFEVPQGSGTIKILASFSSVEDESVNFGLIMDNDGNLYGTGDNGEVFEVPQGSGTIAPLGFLPGGAEPSGNLAMDSSGNLYGTGLFGGAADVGSVFELQVPVQWTGLGSNNLWSDPNNWQADAVPPAGSDLVFPSGAPQPLTDDDLGVAMDSIIVEGNYTISGQALPVDNITILPNASLTVANTLTVSDVLKVAPNGTLTVAGQGGDIHMSGLSGGAAPGRSILDDLGTVTIQSAGVAAGSDTSNTTAINWASIESSLQPPGISNAAWAAIYSNLTAQLGATMGDYAARLAQDTSYLSGLGENVTNSGQLFSFEIQQANGISPVQNLSAATDMTVPVPGLPLSVARAFSSTLIGRNQTGPFGYGWALGGGWGQSLAVQSDGSVVIADPNGSEEIFQPEPSGSYLSQPGDYNVLANIGTGVFTLTTADGQVTQFVNGRVAYIQDSDRNTITAAYTNGLLTSLTDSAGQWIDLTYGAAGLITSLTNSLGQTTQYSYDPTDQYLLSVTQFESASDHTGYTTSYTYDTGSNVETAHALLSVTGPDGTAQDFAYDAEGRLSETSLNNGSDAIHYGYGIGGTVTSTDAAGGVTTYYYDNRALLAKLVDPLGLTTVYSHDPNGNLTQMTDPAGQTYSYMHDPQGNLVESTDPAGNVSSFSYGPLDTLTSATDADGNTTQYQYDAAGDLTSTVYADGTTEKNAFNPIGELLKSTDGDGNVVNYSYNQAGQLLSKTYADGTKTAYTYGPDGELTSVADSTGTTTLTYDSANRLIEVLYPDQMFLKYAYDSAGRRIQMVDQTGYTVNYSYTALGELARLTNGSGNTIVTYSYGATGLLSKENKGNSTFTQFTYDAAGEVLSVINYAPGGAVNSSFVYTYNNLGLCTTETTIDGAWSYDYDATGEFTHAIFVPNATDPDHVVAQDLQYFYDGAGNRTKTIINGVTTTYTVNDRNEYTQVGTTLDDYDANGNVISQTTPTGTTTYTYNINNQVVGIDGPNGDSTLKYDPFGNVYQTAVDGQATQNLVDPLSGNTIGQFTGTGSVIAHYNYGIGLVSQVAQLNGTSVPSYYDFDALGSTTGLSNSSGSYVNSYGYFPFGGSLTTSESIANPFQFVGQWGVTSGSTRPISMHFRLYDPSTGKFMAQDPMGPGAGDLNLSRYVGNAPTTSVDPDGLWAVTFAGSLHIGVGGSVGVTIGTGGIAVTLGAGVGLDVGAGVSFDLNPNATVPVNEETGVALNVGVGLLSVGVSASDGGNLSVSAGEGPGKSQVGASLDQTVSFSTLPPPQPGELENGGDVVVEPGANLDNEGNLLNDPITAPAVANVYGAVDVAPTATLSNDGKLVNGGVIDNSGTDDNLGIDDNLPGDPYLNIGPGTVNNSATAFNGGTFYNLGTEDNLPGGTDNNTGTEYNSGTYDNGGTDENTGNFDNSGEYDVSGTDNDGGDEEDGDGITVAATGNLQITGTLTERVGGSLDISGNVGINTGATLNDFGTVTVEAGTDLTDNGNLDIAKNGAIAISGTVSIESGSTYNPKGNVTVNPGATLTVLIPTITVNANTLSLGTTPQGTPGGAQSFTISGSNLTADITVTAPAGVEISDDGGTSYAQTLDLAQTGGTVAATTILARITANAPAGPFSELVSIDSSGAAKQDVRVSGTAQDAPLSATGNTITATEGQSFSGQVATFTDADPTGALGDYTATIFWGDGESSSGTVSTATDGGFQRAVFQVSGSHAYVEAGTDLPLSVVVVDIGGSTATAGSAANVIAAPSTLTAGSPITLTTTEGGTVSTTVATFTDSDTTLNSGSFSATIDWGDHSPTSTGVISGSETTGYTVNGTHIYAEAAANLPITVAIHGPNGAVATTQSTAVVADASLSATAVAVLLLPGAPLTNVVLATFNDTGGAEPVADYSTTIDWGDGTTNAGSVVATASGFQVTGSHTYSGTANHQVTVTIRDDVGGAQTQVTTQANIGDVNAVYVAAVYLDVLGRAPDPGGLAYWDHLLDSGTAVSSVAAAIAHSDEYYQNFVIRPAYSNLLGRTADAGGVKYWTTQMDAGVMDQELEADLVSSPEFYANAGGTNTAWIDAVYKLLLGRAPDASGENYWNSQLAAGQTLNQVAQGIAGSQENNTQLINDDYFHYLGRVADSGGLAYWLGQFADGSTNEDVIAGFTGSAEYYDEHTS